MGQCKKPQEHSNHVCQLKINQKLEEVKQLKVDATHFCKICEAASNKPECLCDPRPYQGKVGILKWKA